MVNDVEKEKVKCEPLVWLERFKVVKEEGHVAYFDLYEDTVTGKQYFGTKDGLTLREGVAN